MYESEDIRDQPSQVSSFFNKASILAGFYLDLAAPYTGLRWGMALFFLLFFCARIYMLQGFYIVTYTLFLHLLILFLGFLTPLVDPEQELVEDDDGPTLPTSASNEFRPFMRRVPEYKFWIATIKATAIAFGCTFIGFLDIPVFWPILVVYFIALTFYSLKRQIQHMIKYRYVPFNIGKPHRRGKAKTDINYFWRM